MSETPWRRDIEPLLAELVEIRHDLHRHPELGFVEHRTQAIVRRWLERFGYRPVVCATTGLIADLYHEGTSQDLSGRVIALRADMDCLPMVETTALPYRSIHDGRAHKCGHDGHTAILMGVAAVLAGLRGRVLGNVRLLFQPAEEGVDGGGARVMVAQGALEGVDEVYALHNWPVFPRGEIRVRSGPVMAQTHRIFVSIRGVGGHASLPQICRDVVVAGSAMVMALQSVVARGLSYQGGAVVSITQFHAGTTDNVLPEVAELEGTIRTFDESTTKTVLERVKEIVYGTAATFGVNVDLVLEPGYPVLENDRLCAEAVMQAASVVVGAQRVRDEGLPLAGAEDFAYMARTTPGAYFFVGAGAPRGDTPACHHPDFDFDDEIIPTGIAMFLELVRDRCKIEGA